MTRLIDSWAEEWVDGWAEEWVMGGFAKVDNGFGHEKWIQGGR